MLPTKLITKTGTLTDYTNTANAVAIPGFNPLLINQQILIGSYIYIEYHSLLLEIVQFGSPETKTFVVEFEKHKSKVEYQRIDRGRAIHGLVKLIVMDRGLARRICLPISQICSVCNVSASKPAHLTGSPLLLHSGVPKHYYLLWNVNLTTGDDWPDVSEDSCEEGICEDFAGYTCTPLQRAYDLFQRLLEQELLVDSGGHIESGVVSRISARIGIQNGQVAADMCRIHCDRAITTKGRLAFVWDLVDSAKADFDALPSVWDASKVPTLKTLNDNEFERIYGLPKKLQCEELPRRLQIESDWLSSVY
jgi:hypothetical protein